MATAFQFEPVDVEGLDRPNFEGCPDKTVFTTVGWLRFIQEYWGATPLVIRIVADGRHVGWFTGCSFRKFGVRFLGSPIRGWLTPYMGFDLKEPVDKPALLDALLEYATRRLGFLMVVVCDRKVTEEDLKACRHRVGMQYPHSSYYVDLTQPEDAIFAAFKSGYRTCVRKFHKEGGTIVEDYSEDFMKEYYTELQEVFSRNHLVAPNPIRRMQCIYRHVPHSERVLSIRALAKDGATIATSFFFGYGATAFFAGNASYRKYAHYNANQALMWHSMKFWKGKGVKAMDFGGGMDYKENYGGVLHSTPWFVYARWRWLLTLYHGALRLRVYAIKFMQRMRKALDNRQP